MDKNTKLILVVGVVGAGAYFLLKGKNGGTGAQERLIDNDAPPMTPMTPSAPTFSNSIDIKRSGNQGWVGIESADRTKATALLQIGTVGSINGSTPCSISEFWIDTNGKKGAFRCDGQEFYEIPGGSRFMF